jgi:flavin-dependent dehydrogenase
MQSGIEFDLNFDVVVVGAGSAGCVVATKADSCHFEA